MQILFSSVIGYFFGCISPSYLIGRIKGIDLRQKGTGNAGASNTAIIIGWRFGILVALVDIGKAFLSVTVARQLFPDTIGAGLIAGAACVMGHIFPFYMGFRGGKGFASYMGMALGFNWKVGLALLVLAVLITVISDYIVLATMTTVISFPVYLSVTAQSLLPLVLVWVTTGLIIFKHRDNLRRIAKGEEIGLRKVSAHPKVGDSAD